MDMDEWYEEKVLKPKQDWARVSKEAKLKKLYNKMSKRDIEREVRIENFGGKPIEVLYGIPLSEGVRKERIELELDFKYPNRKDKREKRRRNRKSARSRQAKGSRRTEKDFVKGVLHTIKTRARRNGVPFDIVEGDITIPEVCPVFEIPLKWGNKLTDSTPSVDRMIPSLGYVKGNCRVISMRANRIKNNASLDEMKRLVEYMEGKI